MTVWVPRVILFHSFRERGNFWYQIFSEGSVSTYVKCGRIFKNHFLANFLENLPNKKTFKNRLRVDRVTAASFVSPFLLGHGVYPSAENLIFIISHYAVIRHTWMWIKCEEVHWISTRLYRPTYRSCMKAIRYRPDGGETICPARFGHFRAPYGRVDQNVQLPASGFILGFYSNHGPKMHHFELERGTR